MENNNVAIVVPAYNEGYVIGDILKNITNEFKHVVCVDDGSTDDTKAQVLKTKAYLVEHPVNMGQGAAIQTGIEFARQFKGIDYFVTYDADGQHRIDDVHKLIKEIRNSQYDIILGSRFMGSVTEINKTKLFVLKLAIIFSNWTTGLKLTDTHNGLRIFNKSLANNLQITCADMSHASEILEIIAKNNYKYKEIPITIDYTNYSKSKGQPIINSVNIAFDTLMRKISK